MAEKSWNSQIYMNSYIPLLPEDIGGINNTSSRCHTGSIWEYKNYVVAGVTCMENLNNAKNYIKTMPKGSFNANWTTVKTVPGREITNADMYIVHKNVMYGATLVNGKGSFKQVVVIMPEVVPN